MNKVDEFAGLWRFAAGRRAAIPIEHESFFMQGKTVVATGATSGIGEVAVGKLAAMGARIVFVARDAKRAEATLARLEQIAPGRGHRAHIADLR